MGVMYDSTSVAAIPADATIVAGYVDGNWPTYNDMTRLFPFAAHVSITVLGQAGAMVADCEAGDLTPRSAAHWAAGEIAGGRRPCIYYSRSEAANVSAALRAANVATAAVDFWVADWTGHAHLLAGSVATQWASPATGSGGNFDVSETAPDWPVTAPKPAPPPTPPPTPPPPGDFMPPTLHQGDLSPAVRSAQALLALHAPLAVDGDFGPVTDTAVRNFQTIMHLSVDGIVGPQTWTALCTFG